MKSITNYLKQKKLHRAIISSAKENFTETKNLTIAVKMALLAGNSLIDHTAIDLITKNKLMYIFTGKKGISYISSIVKNDIEKSIQTLAKLAYVTEREIFEFFGIFFTEAFDLRRLLTDYSLIGNPLKKAYPLIGFIETRYSVNKALQQREILLPQDIRDFQKNNTWKL